MERRNFIKKSLLATGALSLSDHLLHATDLTGYANESMTAGNHSSSMQTTPLRKAIMWSGVGVPGSVLDKCKAVKAAGFEGIEPLSHADRNEFIDAMKATGLVAASVCNSKHGNLPMSHPDPEQRKQAIKDMIVAMEDAKAYGTDAVLLVPGRVNENVSYDDCWRRSTECIKELVPVAEEMQIKICIENVWNNFILSPIEMRSYINQFNSKFVGVYFDCGNILVYGWPEHWISSLRDRIYRIHIKEFSKTIADKEGRSAGFRVQLTEGDVRWKEVMEQTRLHYKGVWLTTEQGNSRSLEELQDLNKRFDKILAL
jgi:hexulose-6-phosphate isomerase